MITGGNSGTYERYESSVRSYCRAFPDELVSARNAVVTVGTGKHYIDFLAGCGALNYGHNDPDMKEALLTYIANDGVALSLDFHSRAKHQFIDDLARLIFQPRNLDYKIQFTGPTGSNAVEAALKLARKITGRPDVIAFTNGFHGVSLGSLAATGNKFHRGAAGVCLPNIVRLPYDGYSESPFDTADYIEYVISDPSSGIEPPAAFLVELVQGEGGLNTASSNWLRKLKATAERHQSLLIVDDIQAGCGRTGPFFSFETTELSPDIVVLAKSLSGFGLPMSAVLMRRGCDIWQPGEHNGTFRGNNHAFVTASVALRKFWSDNVFVDALSTRAMAIEDALQTLSSHTGWRSKGRGLIRGLQCPSSIIAGSIQDRCIQNGLILERCGPHDEVLKILPPLTIESDVLAEGLSMFSNAVRNAFDAQPMPESSTRALRRR